MLTLESFVKALFNKYIKAGSLSLLILEYSIKIKLKPGLSSTKDLKTSKLSSKKDISLVELFKYLKTINPCLITLILS